MRLTMSNHDIYIPDGVPAEQALSRTTHLAVGAHQDDLEIMAYDGILQCFGQKDKWFTGVVVTNGAGSPRDGIYSEYTDEEMQNVRRLEQRKAALIGEYGACVQLAHPSSAVKSAADKNPVNDLTALLTATQPEVVYTHNLADKHDTHVGTALKLIEAIRALPREKRPKKLYGCEVWRGLDWLCNNEKVIFDVSERSNIAASLIGVFDSQVAGGKRYDLATSGRRLANATYLDSHSVDEINAVIYGIDMTVLIEDDSIEPLNFIMGYIKRFENEVADRIAKLKI